MIALDDFAAQIGTEGAVSVAGLGTRGGPRPGTRVVRAPAGIDWIQPDEMTVCCGAGTPVDELVAALAGHRQSVALPAGGTVGGALAVGQADVRQLGWGPVRDTLLQARFVDARGEVVKAGGPTVKNVSGFDLCRVLVGSLGAIGCLGEVILRTRPLPRCSQWFTAEATDPAPVFTRLYRPSSVLWDGGRVWALLEGHPADVADQAAACGLTECAGPPPLPTGSRRLVPPLDLTGCRGAFVAELGVGVVHHAEPWAAPVPTPRLEALASSVRLAFDPIGRFSSSDAG